MRGALPEDVVFACEYLLEVLIACFEEEAYLKRLALLKGRASSRQQRVFQKIERFAAGLGLHLDSGRKEFPILPVVDGKRLSPEEYQGLPRPARPASPARARAAVHRPRPMKTAPCR